MESTVQEVKSQVEEINQIYTPGISDVEKDLISNLDTLEFGEDVISKEQGELLTLRKRSNITTVNIVAHLSYFVAILNEVCRKIHLEKEEINYGELEDYKRIKIGFIGCGRIGTHILNALFLYGQVKPHDVMISVRRPELLLQNFKEQGVHCEYNNIKLTESADLIILCLPPSEVENVLSDVRKHVHGFIYTIVTGLPGEKIRSYLRYNDVYKPVYTINKLKDLSDIQWDFVPVNQQLKFLDFREKYCPLNINDEQKLLFCEPKIIEILFFLSLNYCLAEKFSEEKSVEIVMKIMYRKCDFNTLLHGKLFTNLSENKMSWDRGCLFTGKYFQKEKFIISKIEENDTILTEIFKDPTHKITIGGRLQYKAIFDRFTDWRR